MNPDYASLPHQIIAHIYEAVLTPESWGKGLGLLCTLTGSEHAAMTSLNRVTNEAGVHENAGLSDSCQHEFSTHYASLDPARLWIDGIAVGDWYVDHQHVGIRAMQKSVFYQDFLRKFGMSSISASPLQRDGTMTSFLVLQYGAGQAFQHPTANADIGQIVVHLQRALRLRQHCEAITKASGLAYAALSQWRTPLYITDETGQLSYANAAAESLLRRQAGLHVTAGRLGLSGPNRLQLVKLLRAACGCDGPAIAGGIQTTRMARTAMTDKTDKTAKTADAIDIQPLQIIVTPLPVEHALTSCPTRPLALVLVHDPNSPCTTGTELLRQIYGFTASEARIALLVSQGASPAQAALQAGVSLATVRTQLSAIFYKTGTTRQAGLMRLLTAVLSLDAQPEAALVMG